jgi:hypothetical protein
LDLPLNFPKTKEDYKAFNLDVEPYLEHFYIERAGAQVFGHYNPLMAIFGLHTLCGINW